MAATPRYTPAATAAVHGNVPSSLAAAGKPAPAHAVSKLKDKTADGQGAKMIGAQGSEYVATILHSVNPPQSALQQVQATCGVSHELCKPLLQMLDYLDISRREAHLFILNRGKQLLLDWLASVKTATAQRSSERSVDEPESREELELQQKLERLLVASFRYMGVAELKQVLIVCGRGVQEHGGAKGVWWRLGARRAQLQHPLSWQWGL